MLSRLRVCHPLTQCHHSLHLSLSLSLSLTALSLSFYLILLVMFCISVTALHLTPHTSCLLCLCSCSASCPHAGPTLWRTSGSSGQQFSSQLSPQLTLGPRRLESLSCWCLTLNLRWRRLTSVRPSDWTRTTLTTWLASTHGQRWEQLTTCFSLVVR